MIDNPIVAKAISLLMDGKVIIRIEPEKLRHEDRRVIFHLEDGTRQTLSTVGDHETFMRWWKTAGEVFRAIKMIEPLREA